MPLSLVRRPGSPNWYVRGHVRGQPVFQSAGTPERKLAKAFAAKLEEDLYKRALPGARPAVTFLEAALSYLEHADPGEGERRYVRRWLDVLAPGWRNKRQDPALFARLDELDQATVAKRLSLVLRTKSPSPATRARTLSPLAAILAHAARRGWCDPPRFDMPKLPKGRLRWLTPAEAQALIAVASPHMRFGIHHVLCTGARWGELVDALREDADLAAARIRYRDTKSGHDRLASLPSAALEAIRGLPFAEGPIFRRDDGEPYADRHRLEEGQGKRAFRSACARAGLGTDVTPHVLRHTWASWFYALSTDLLLLRDEGGWASTRMVERYAHLMRSDQVAGIEKVWGAWHPRLGDVAARARAAAPVAIPGAG